MIAFLFFQEGCIHCINLSKTHKFFMQFFPSEVGYTPCWLKRELQNLKQKKKISSEDSAFVFSTSF